MVKKTAGFLLLLVLLAGAAPAPKVSAPPRAKPSAEKPKKSSPEARWRKLPAERKKRLIRFYRKIKSTLSEKEWKRCRRLHEAGKCPRIRHLPPRWRGFLVRYARWARTQLKKLPKEERERIDRLPPAKRAEALKAVLRPLFRRHLEECRKAAREVFTPLELKILGQLAPRDRVKALNSAGRSASDLISPWSWRRYQALGPRKALVREYLLIPNGLRGFGRMPPLHAHGRRGPAGKGKQGARRHRPPTEGKTSPGAHPHHYGAPSRPMSPPRNRNRGKHRKTGNFGPTGKSDGEVKNP